MSAEAASEIESTGGEQARPEDDVLIGLPQIAELCGVRRSTIYAWREDPKVGFPKPGYFQGKESLMRFWKSEVLAWRAANLQPEIAKPLPKPRRRRTA
jgi:predicted DNA-binding transcriptional regulator AlpA